METLKLITEDRAEDLRWRTQVAVLSRTPMDRKSGRAMERYSKRLHKVLDDMVPWARSERTNSLLRRRRMAAETGVTRPEVEGAMTPEERRSWDRALEMSMTAAGGVAKG